MAQVPPWFADYYRKASISPQREWLELRWRGIEAFLAKGFPGLDLVLLHFGLPLLDDRSAARFASKPSPIEDLEQAMYQHDTTFPIQPTPSHELRVLAACAITQAIESGSPSKRTDTLALGTLCAAAQGAREATVPALLVKAAAYLQRRALDIRDLRRLPKVADGLASDNDALTSKIAESLRQAVTGLEHNLHEQLKIAQEENNILWWIMGEHSNGLNQRFADLAIGTACLVAGQELADLCLPPGPVAVRAFLDRVLRTAHPQLPQTENLLTDALASTPDDWLRKHSVKGVTEHFVEIMPIHGAFISRAAKITIKDPVALAYQTLLEAQLLRVT